jgi:hypothetical protein
LVETAGGDVRVRLFDGADQDWLFLKGGPAGLEDSERIPRSGVVKLSTVVSRNET